MQYNILSHGYKKGLPFPQNAVSRHPKKLPLLNFLEFVNIAVYCVCLIVVHHYTRA